MSSRLARVQARMAETATDLIVVGPSSHLVWLLGMSPHGDERPVMLIATPTKAGILMPALNADSQRGYTDLPFYSWADAEGPDMALAKLLADLGANGSGLRVALDESMRADFALLLLGALKAPRHTFLTETLGHLRAQKDQQEFALLKAAAGIDDQAMAAAFAHAKPGMTELELDGFIRDFFRSKGARPEFSLVCFGENGAFPHHHSGERVLKEDDAILIDIGCRKDGYPSDMTRVGSIGRKPADFDKVHAVLEQAVRAAVAAAKPGVLAKTVDAAARDVITAAGYGPNFLHRTGHGLGIDVHEPPYITATSETVLEAGNVFSIEPGIYLSGRFGIRLEEIVFLGKDGAVILSELPRTAFVAGA
ncbi:MAG: aminopeptidase P family protein [Hyphomicrobiales bacterium]|nr:MAG: aminopeptidase P family protein [Hyphomicrobiales bacterium]